MQVYLRQAAAATFDVTIGWDGLDQDGKYHPSIATFSLERNNTVGRLASGEDAGGRGGGP